MKCPDCNERKAVIMSTAIDRVRRCNECDDKKRSELGFAKPSGFATVGKYRTDFEPYKLTNGNMRELHGDPDYNREDRSIYIRSAAHEDAVMKQMNCHIGEVGEDLMGHKIGDKPDIDYGDRK